MKLSLLTISSLLLLAIDGSAQQEPSVTVNSNLSVNSEIRLATIIQELEPQKVKLFTKTFVVDKNDKINLSNQYGKITIKTWDRNEIKVDAEIRAYANTAPEAQKMLDFAAISASKLADMISFTTDIEVKNNWNFNGKKREVKVFMTVYMPSTNALSVLQEYGEIIMGDYSGATSLAVEYGTLTTGDLKSNSNVIRVEYGKATIKSVTQAKISHEYGSGTTIGTAGSLTINAEHTNIKIGSLRNSSKANLEYGKLTVDDLGASIAVAADYSTISLAFNPSFKSPLSVATNYGSFKYGANVTAKRRRVDDEDSNQSYTGIIGKGDYRAGENVSIKSEYTTVIFK